MLKTKQNQPVEPTKRKCLTAENETPFVLDSKKLEPIYKEIVQNSKKIEKLKKALPNSQPNFEDVEDMIYPFNEALSISNLQFSKQSNTSLSTPALENYKNHRKMIATATHIAKNGFDSWRPSFCETDLEFTIFLSFDNLSKVNYTGEEIESESSNLKVFASQRRYRNETDSELIVGNGGRDDLGVFIPTHGKDVNYQMFKLFEDYKKAKKEGANPIETAARFDAQFVRIQPFLDCNKRLGLLGANYILTEQGLPSIFFGSDKEPSHYVYLLFNAIVERDLTPLTEYFAEKIKTTQERTIQFYNNATILKKMKEIYGVSNLDEILGFSDDVLSDYVETWKAKNERK